MSQNFQPKAHAPRDEDRRPPFVSEPAPEEEIIETPVEESIVEEPEKVPVTGVVTDCLRLNIRKAPNPNAEIVSVIECLTEVVVDMDASTDAFYKICTAAGIEGFCMKKFIAVRPQ